MNVPRLMSGLAILNKYYDQVEDLDIAAGHDIIYFPLHKGEIDPADLQLLDQLRFHFNDDTNCWFCFT